jgi:alpha-L-fucosidase
MWNKWLLFNSTYFSLLPKEKNIKFLLIRKMIKLSIALLIIFFQFYANVVAQNTLPKPTQAQLNWHKLEYYWFIHFGPNTFTDVEWGNGKEKEEIFNPKKLDCNQWCKIAKASGATQIIITAKHHDGFCLWPSKFSKHTVAHSKWRNGKGDVLKELSAACKKYGLKFGVYISPWDRNHPDYGTEKYNEVFVNMMKELFTNYGEINELWWDGANGEGPNGKKQVYDWDLFKSTVRKLSPNTVIFSDVGPDIRWCGNENGIAGETNFNNLSIAGFEPGEKAPTTAVLNRGEENGTHYIPAECDVSIRPGWFYHKAEDDKVKTPQQLFNLYLKSVGRGANLLLNIPPTPDGLIHKNDSAALIGLNKLRDKNFAKNLALTAEGYFINDNGATKIKSLTDGNKNTKQLISYGVNEQIGIEWKSNQTLNCIILNEDLTNGQKINDFSITLIRDGNIEEKIIKGKTIGSKRIYTFPLITVSAIYFKNISLNPGTSITEIEAYKIDDKLVEVN